MDIVVDTNIVVNALKSTDNDAKSIKLFRDIAQYKHTVILSPAILREYYEVLHRPELGIKPETADKMIDMLVRHAEIIIPKPTTSSEVEMHDEDDRVFFDAAKCYNAKLITRNYKDYPVHELITLIEELY